MLSKYIYAYLISHGVPAVISFASLAVFSRLLSPQEYGTYAIVFAVASMLNAIFFEWIKVSMLRFYHRYMDYVPFYTNIKMIFLLIMALTIILGIPFLLQDYLSFTWLYLALALALSWSQSWTNITLSLFRSKLSPWTYGKLSFSKATLGLLFGTVFILLGWKDKGLLIGLILGTTITLIYPTYKYWGNRVGEALDYKLIKEFFKYGFPLTLTLLLSILIHNSDRLIISYLLGKEETGQYSVAYDLSENTIFTLMMVVNLAAFPIVMKTVEREGVESAYNQVRKNNTLFLLLSIPAVFGFILLSENIVYFLLGEKYRNAALLLIPVLAFCAFLRGFKLYCMDIIFHIHQSTSKQVIPVLIAAIINIALTFFLVPSYGILGAAIATLISYFIAVLISWVLIRKSYKLLIPLKDFTFIIVSTIIMSLALLPFYKEVGFVWLIVQVMIGISVYALMILVFNIGNCRVLITKLWKSKFSDQREQKEG